MYIAKITAPKESTMVKMGKFKFRDLSAYTPPKTPKAIVISIFPAMPEYLA